MERCFVALDREVVLQAERNFLLRSGGTTAVVALETATHIVVANVGDSPACVFDAESGLVLARTDDHCPQNPSELRRVLDRGGIVLSHPEYGDYRMCSPTRRSTVSVTRALGQYEFKAGLALDDYTVTSRPQCYVWSKADLAAAAAAAVKTASASASSSAPAPAPRLFLSLYSDSFTEAVTDSLTAPIDPASGRRPQVIANIVPHDLVAQRLALALRRHAWHASRAAAALAREQVELFKINGTYCGDNTSLVLVAL